MEIEVPKVTMTNYGKIQFATEVCFTSLIDSAKKLGLKVDPVLGLMYMPKQETTREFQLACRKVLSDLGVIMEEGENDDSTDDQPNG